MAYTVFDGPPVDGVSEYGLLQEQSDGLILVVRTDHTDRSILFGALQSIPKDKLLGSVINSYKESPFWKKRGGYYS
jgi:Mrp family chromosome partitioning ATPase